MWDFSKRKGVQVTEPADFYISPTDSEVSGSAKEYKVQVPYTPLVRDLSHLASGGTFREFEDVATELTNNYSKLSAPELQQEVDLAHWQHDFLSNLEVSSLPGITPLQKSMFLMRYLQQKRQQQQDDGGEPCDRNGNPCSGSGEGDAEDLNNALKNLRNMSQEDRDLFGMGSDMSDPGQAEKMIEFILQQAPMVEVARNLDVVSGLYVYKLSEFHPDPNGKETRVRPMRELSEIPRMLPSEWVYPAMMRIVRQVTGEAMVRMKIVRTEKKQLLYVLVDDSGSMFSADRIQKACGALMSRIIAVARGDAELWFRFFNTSCGPETRIQTKEEAKAALSRIQKNRFNGGGTAIDQAIVTAEKRIREIMATEPTHRPEIMVISDGDDRINTTSANLDGIRLHSITVSGRNEQLNRLARSTGGVGIHI